MRQQFAVLRFEGAVDTARPYQQPLRLDGLMGESLLITNAGSRAQKIADKTSLPRGEAASEPCASQPFLLTLLVSDEVYRLFQRGWLARVGVSVTAIAKIGRREYFW
jgi:hypothetical protein